MRSVNVPGSRAFKFLRVSCLVSVSAMLAACSVNSDRFAYLTDKASDPQAPIVDSSSPQSAGDNYDRAVQSSSLDDPTAVASPADPPQAVAEAPGGVTVNQGDTLYSIARTNNVHVKDLIATNDLQAPYRLSVGQHLRLPRDSHGQTRVASSSAYSPEPAYAPPQQNVGATSGTHSVQSGETLYSLGRKYNVHPHSIARANGISPSAGLTIGQVVSIPEGPGSDRLPAKVATAPTSSEPSVTEPAPVPTPEQSVSIEKEKVPPVPKLENDRTAELKTSLPSPEQRSSSQFRWPLKGRIISTFGPKPSGSRNDGINIAVPVGTSVRAAENGVVAYAGNELKGYGNLILIRHDGGWVTAYAHNKELFVKRGDRITRGRVIAKSGSSGSVSSPQLHFELRKGADAVDPMKYLSSTKVAGG